MPLQRISPVVACVYPAAAATNAPLAAAFDRLGEADFARRSHFIDGRFENLYVGAERLPGLGGLLQFVEERARAILRLGLVDSDTGDAPPARLRTGFWLNAMGPGERTSRHTHDEDDERLSAVYYVRAPAGCGDLLFHDHPFEVRVRPEPGLLLFFPPGLAHSVEPNRSGERRLSIAFNLGPDGD